MTADSPRRGRSVGEELGRKALTFGYPFDLDGGRVDGLLEASKSLGDLVESRADKPDRLAAPADERERDLRDRPKCRHEADEHHCLLEEFV
jgi:hypothetical protein